MGNPGHLLDHVVLARIDRFLYRHAALLDRREYAAWWSTLTEDIHYLVTAKVMRDATVGSLEFSVIDENAVELKQRVDQISTPKLTHAENPPSVTRRYVTNVMAQQGEAPNEFHASYNLLVYRTTYDVLEGSLYSAAGEDVIREVDGEFRLAKRTVRLDQSVMFGAISILF